VLLHPVKVKILNLNSAIQPCVITPCEGEDFKFLILPVKSR